VLERLVCGHLAKEARHCDDGWLCVYEHSLVTEHMHIQDDLTMSGTEGVREACASYYRVVS
jgi:hypothetical protein